MTGNKQHGDPRKAHSIPFDSISGWISASNPLTLAGRFEREGGFLASGQILLED
jgi:hypothetical protein